MVQERVAKKRRARRKSPGSDSTPLSLRVNLQDSSGGESDEDVMPALVLTSDDDNEGKGMIKCTCIVSTDAKGR